MLSEPLIRQLMKQHPRHIGLTEVDRMMMKEMGSSWSLFFTKHPKLQTMNLRSLIDFDSIGFDNERKDHE